MLSAEVARPSLRYLLLETTRRCNLRCVQCAASEENNFGNYESGDLPIEAFNQLLPMLQTLRPQVQLNGHGETLLHPNFIEMLEKLIGIGCRVKFQTNGMLLTPDKVEKIIRPGVEGIVISIDAASPELFRKLRRGASLGKILENVRLINETKKRLRTEHPQLSFQFVAMRQNIHELGNVIKMAGDLAVTTVSVAELTEYSLTSGQSLVNDPLFGEYVLEAEAIAHKSGVNLILPAHIPGKATALPSNTPTPSQDTHKGLRKTCKWPWENMFVQFNGKVQPCCYINESYGDLCIQSFEEVWLSPKYQALRTAILTDEPFAECVNCPQYGWEPIDSCQPQTNAALVTTENKRSEDPIRLIFHKFRDLVNRTHRVIGRKNTWNHDIEVETVFDPTKVVRVEAGSVDLCEPVKAASTSTIKTGGWAADLNAGKPANVAVVSDGKQLTVTLNLSGSRPDVAKAFNNSNLEKTGWDAGLPASSLGKGKHKVEFYAVLSNNTFAPLHCGAQKFCEVEVIE